MPPVALLRIVVFSWISLEAQFQRKLDVEWFAITNTRRACTIPGLRNETEGAAGYAGDARVCEIIEVADIEVAAMADEFVVGTDNNQASVGARATSISLAVSDCQASVPPTPMRTVIKNRVSARNIRLPSGGR